MLELTWLIPALPLAGFLVLVVAGRRLGEPVAGWLATAAVAASFVVTLGVFIALRGSAGGEEHRFTQTLFTWIPAGGFTVDVGFLVDPLSITMCLFVTGIAALIHLYSVGYMHGDPRFSKFFLYLNLFVFSMLMLVLGDNLLVTFLGWEGVGTCSYLLISFWHEKDANASAGKKAFVTNRIGDWGFMVAIFLCFATIGSINYLDIFHSASGLATTTATALAVLLFIGAVGKSAQLPLMVWLPDAMAGPTPVSALIHAATMVTAGVYLMTRMNPVLFQASPWVGSMIMIVGAATALFAATIAVAQSDIKKVLAYSTVSQLGFMFMAVGSGAYIAAIFHMVTHAFFKALLFLGSGSVIHGMDGEQDMRRMGGLRKYMPITAFTFVLGWLAIAGIPPFAGFWSKDEVLLGVFNRGGVVGYGVWGVGVATALLTAFYMSRLVYMTFFGEPRWDDAAAGPGIHDEAEAEAEAAAPAADAAVAVEAHAGGHHPHESPWTMTAPLVVLGLATFIAGFLNASIWSKLTLINHWLEPVVEGSEAIITVGTLGKLALSGVAVAVGVIGIVAGHAVYGRRAYADQPQPNEFLANAWYYDSTLARVMGGPGRKLFDAVAWFDSHIIDGAVNGVATLVAGAGGGLRRLQTGYVRQYALGIALGAVLITAVIMVRGVVL